MNLSDYFAFYELNPDFEIDTKSLRQKYLQISKNFHPDYFTLQEDKKAETLKITAYNNDAYKVLSDFESRASYLMKTLGLYDEEDKTQLPPDFLMDVMELNERIEDADEGESENIKIQIKANFDQCREKLNQLKKIWEQSNKSPETTKELKSEFQKLKYYSNLLSKI